MKVLLLLLALLLSPGIVQAQKNCKKGIPCGNTCISATKTCRQAPPPAPLPLHNAKPNGMLLHSPAYPFAASPRGRTYYANISGCRGLLRLQGYVYFRTRGEAEAKGLTRSTQAGC